jgi:hypothetical protein
MLITKSVAILMLVIPGATVFGLHIAAGQPFPSAGAPNPAMTGAPGARAATAPLLQAPAARPPAPQRPAATIAPPAQNRPLPPGSAPRAVTVARATEIPRCTAFVDAGATGQGGGTAQAPHKTIAAAVAAASNGAVICVAEGVYAEQIKPGVKAFTLAGGFQRGKAFQVRDSATYVTKATGQGGSFIRIDDPAPTGAQLTAIDGFDISGYSQAIVREYYEPQRFDLTNNHIHDNKCGNDQLAGGGFALNNVSGRIEGNVFRNNSCGRGGAGFLNDSAKQSNVAIERNLVDGNAGTEPEASHGGAIYVFGKTLRITGNLFTRNTVTQWGAGLFIGAWTEGGTFTTATLAWNVYRDNRAGNGGGGMFCDDGATCISSHEVYDRNCGGNIMLDSGSEGSSPTIARFDHLAVGCDGPGPGVRVDKGNDAPDAYSFVNALFWGNAPGVDFVASCDRNCSKARIDVAHSMVQTKYLSQGLTVRFGDGIVTPADPLFADPAGGDFHLKSVAGRWTPSGYVRDTVTSPAIGKGFPGKAAEQNPERAGKRSELGAYGDSGEASLIR